MWRYSEMFKISTDVEAIALLDGKRMTSQEILTGHRGHKEYPIEIPSGIVHRDNVALEFALRSPATTENDFVRNIETIISDVQDLLGITLDFTPSWEVPQEKLNTIESYVFGCEPDFNAYTRDMNRNPNAYKAGQLRSMGGHVHLDLQYESFEEQCLAVRALDIIVGLRSVPMDIGGLKRKALYGRAGSFRPKEYGIEYRVPSNWWLFDKSYMRFMYRSCKEALERMHEFENLTRDEEDDIQVAINTGNTQMAKLLTKQYR